jgi:hypothetical protein
MSTKDEAVDEVVHEVLDNCSEPRHNDTYNGVIRGGGDGKT